MTSKHMRAFNRRVEAVFRCDTLRQSVVEIARSMNISHPYASKLLQLGRTDARVIEGARMMAAEHKRKEDAEFN